MYGRKYDLPSESGFVPLRHQTQSVCRAMLRVCHTCKRNYAGSPIHDQGTGADALQGYMKGYISHEKQMVVLAKTNPFPSLSSVPR